MGSFLYFELRPHLRPFFRGSFLTLARDIPAFCSYFMTYELLRERFKESDGSLGLGSTAVIGGLSGVVGWAVEIPLDALKSRHQGCLRYNSFSLEPAGQQTFISGREPCLEHSERCGVMEDPGFSSEAQGWCC